MGVLGRGDAQTLHDQRREPLKRSIDTNTLLRRRLEEGDAEAAGEGLTLGVRDSLQARGGAC